MAMAKRRSTSTPALLATCWRAKVATEWACVHLCQQTNEKKKRRRGKLYKSGPLRLRRADLAARVSISSLVFWRRRRPTKISLTFFPSLASQASRSLLISNVYLRLSLRSFNSVSAQAGGQTSKRAYILVASQSKWA